MVYLDPELGHQLPERSYAEGCDLTMDTIKVEILYPSGNMALFTPNPIESNGYLCACAYFRLVWQGYHPT